MTGYDPRFEESLLILFPGQKPVTLLLGNEGLTYLATSRKWNTTNVLYQETFSLPGQPRGDNARLAEILRTAGCTAGQQLGVVGWKSFDSREAKQPAHTLEIPSFVVDVLGRNRR